MKISIGSDHRGYELKNFLTTWLKSEGHEVFDVGTDSRDSTDYTDYALDVARMISQGLSNLGVLICGTGIGMSMAANKARGIRAARVCTVADAEMTKRHNNANILCMGADTGVDQELARKIILAWMTNVFEGGRHNRRIDKISLYENENYG